MVAFKVLTLSAAGRLGAEEALHLSSASNHHPHLRDVTEIDQLETIFKNGNCSKTTFEMGEELQFLQEIDN